MGYDGTRTELYAALKDKFITDDVPPAITGASLSTDIISPNGDDRFETTIAKLTATALIRWGFRVQPLDGSVALASVRSGTVKDKTPTFTWNGRDADGDVVPDGKYRITLWVADASDNRSDKAWTVTVDTKRPTVTTTAEEGDFSPDGNGFDDYMTLTWTSSRISTARSGSWTPAARRDVCGASTTAGAGRRTGTVGPTPARCSRTGPTPIA